MSIDKKNIIIISPLNKNKTDNNKNPLSDSLKLGNKKVLETELLNNYANQSDNNRRIRKALKRLNSSPNATNKPTNNSQHRKTSQQRE